MENITTFFDVDTKEVIKLKTYNYQEGSEPTQGACKKAYGKHKGVNRICWEVIYINNKWKTFYPVIKMKANNELINFLAGDWFAITSMSQTCNFANLTINNK